MLRLLSIWHHYIFWRPLINIITCCADLWQVTSSPLLLSHGVKLTCITCNITKMCIIFSKCIHTRPPAWQINKTSPQINALIIIMLWIHKWQNFVKLRVSQYQKGKTNLDLLEQETVSGSGISWAMCKSAPRPRQITTPPPHHSVFYKPDVLPPA